MALTVISPVYGTTTHQGNGVAGSSALLTPPTPAPHYPPFGMPSSSLSSSSLSPAGLSSPSISSSHNHSSSAAGTAPPPPPPPPVMATPSRGLHHQPSMRGGITSPQPVGVHLDSFLSLSLLFSVRPLLFYLYVGFRAPGAPHCVQMSNLASPTREKGKQILLSR